MVTPARVELAQNPAPEAGALSTELRGHVVLNIVNFCM